MTRATCYLLDSGPLGLLAHERPSVREPIRQWVTQQLLTGSIVFISQVAEYEVRRELIRLIQKQQLPISRLIRLDDLKKFCAVLPMQESTWKVAAELWATARNQGRPTAQQAALDADVLIAAQAKEIDATVVTLNQQHFTSLCKVHSWKP